MINITESAVQELKAALSENQSDSDQVFRLDIDIDSEECSFQLGQKQEGDEIVEKDGVAILAMSPEASEAFAEATIDCVNTPQGTCLTIYGGSDTGDEEPEAGCNHNCHCQGHEA